MMVVKEPQEMSEAVKNYPEVEWNLPGMRPLQVGLVLTLVATSIAGVLSSPLFNLASGSITGTTALRQFATTHQSSTIAVTAPQISISQAPDPVKSQNLQGAH